MPKKNQRKRWTNKLEDFCFWQSTKECHWERWLESRCERWMRFHEAARYCDKWVGPIVQRLSRNQLALANVTTPAALSPLLWTTIIAVVNGRRRWLSRRASLCVDDDNTSSRVDTRVLSIPRRAPLQNALASQRIRL